MNLYHYEFQPDEIECQCQSCEKLNNLENRSFILIDEQKEKDEQELRKKIQAEDIRKISQNLKELGLDIKIQGQKIEAERKKIIKFAEKEIS